MACSSTSLQSRSRVLDHQNQKIQVFQTIVTAIDTTLIHGIVTLTISEVWLSCFPCETPAPAQENGRILFCLGGASALIRTATATTIYLYLVVERRNGRYSRPHIILHCSHYIKCPSFPIKPRKVKTRQSLLSRAMKLHDICFGIVDTRNRKCHADHGFRVSHVPEILSAGYLNTTGRPKLEAFCCHYVPCWNLNSYPSDANPSSHGEPDDPNNIKAHVFDSV